MKTGSPDNSPARMPALPGGMDTVLLCLMILATFPSGCTTKSSANAAARAAYSAGQQQTMERMLQNRNSVTVMGPVRNPLVAWTQDLTLARAIVASDYYGKSNPREIVIVRSGRPMAVDPKQLLAGEDVPLEAGDVVHIR